MKVIVGMTSWSKRIGTAAITLRSILKQTHMADSVELNLDLENFPRGVEDLPEEIVELQRQHSSLHINFEARDFKVWLKSVPSIRRHYGEEYVLFTLDDDCTYYPNYIEESLRAFAQHPDCDYMNTTSDGIAGEYMVYRSRFLEKCFPYLTDEFISQVRVDDCCWFWFARKFGAKLAPRAAKEICKDRLQGYSYRREFGKLPDGVKDASEWTKQQGSYPVDVLKAEMQIIQKHLNVR